MDIPPALILGAFVFLILLAVGIVVFIITYLGRGSSKKAKPILGSSPARAEPPPDEPVTQVPAAQVPAAQAPARQAPAEPPVETPAYPGEVMRVIRDPQSSRILIEVNGQRYDHIREIKDAQVGRRVLWAIADLVRFTGGMAANPQALQSVGKPKPDVAVEQALPASPPPMAPARPAVSPRPAASPASSPARPATVAGDAGPLDRDPVLTRDIGRTITDYFRRGFQPTPKVEAPRSFIDEIEEILQAYIERLSEPLPYEVHVMADPEGALQIEVGMDLYSNPDQVPDLKVRKLIKAAVAEWEKR